ncbi:MAG: hypothetical protein HYY30_05415 [Chloroflexi bacterium]|nr:hypothetical protein [Chloroflexota bacterium]
MSSELDLPAEFILTGSPIRLEAVVWAAARGAGCDADTNQRRPITSFYRECEVLAPDTVGYVRLSAQSDGKTLMRLVPHEWKTDDGMDRFRAFCCHLLQELRRLGLY